MCSAAPTEPETAKHRDKCGEKQIGKFLHAEKHRLFILPVVHILDLYLVCDEDAEIDPHTDIYSLAAFVNHDECGGLGSQRADLFRTHKEESTVSLW